MTWVSNAKAWMTSTLFKDWVNDVNKQMRKQKRKIILFLDNATSHTHDKLSNVTLKFLPPNTTSAIQPLDQGIIRAVKWIICLFCVIFTLLLRQGTFIHIFYTTKLFIMYNYSISKKHVNMIEIILARSNQLVIQLNSLASVPTPLGRTCINRRSVQNGHSTLSPGNPEWPELTVPISQLRCPLPVNLLRAYSMTYLTGRIVACIEITLFREKNQFTITCFIYLIVTLICIRIGYYTVTYYL